MACAFTRLGARVTLIDVAPRLLPGAAPAASQVLATALADQGIAIRLGSRATGYDAAGGGLDIEGPLRTTRVAGVDAVLVAIGRAPNVSGFEHAVATGPGGIIVDGWGRTSAPGVWAVGDVTPVAHQTHAANAHARRIVQRIALPWIPPVGRPPVIPHAVFSDPEVAWVGPSPDALAYRFHPEALVHLRVDLAGTDRGLTDDVRHGFVAITAVRLTGRVVSATIVGPHASELLPLLTFAVSRRTSLLRLQRQVYAYPTFAGAIGAAADDFARRTLPRLGAEAAAYGRHRWRRGRPQAPP